MLSTGSNQPELCDAICNARNLIPPRGAPQTFAHFLAFLIIWVSNYTLIMTMVCEWNVQQAHICVMLIGPHTFGHILNFDTFFFLLSLLNQGSNHGPWSYEAAILPSALYNKPI